MNKVTVELDSAGIRSFLRSDEMKDLMVDFASNIRQSAGDGYEQDSYVGRNRVNAMVYAGTYQAKRDNLKHNTLLKVMRGIGEV